MARQNVGTPRMYLNVAEWLASVGVIDNLDPVFRTLPVGPYVDVPADSFPLISDVTLTNPFLAVLGHNSSQMIANGTSSVKGGIVNYGDAIYPGFSITETESAATSISYSAGAGVGSCIIGTFYDFPHSPDLSLTLSYEYAGIKSITTRGGATLSNQYYTSPPAWGEGDLGAWELGGNPVQAKSGRRVWDLNFSFLSDSSVFPTVASLTNLGTSFESNDTGARALLDEDSFQRVIHLLRGGQLPFIFQPDNSNRNQGFAICKLDMNNFKFSQSAPNLYSIKLKIKEVW